WEIGRRIVEEQQRGRQRAPYGEELLERLAKDLTTRFGRGFSRHNLARFRDFYVTFSVQRIRATLSLKSPSVMGTEIGATSSLESPSGLRRPVSGESPHDRATDTGSTAAKEPAGRDGMSLAVLARAFPLPWSHYVLLVSRSRSPEALEFYHTEALRGGWSVRQLTRQIDSQFYERTALSRNKAAMLKKGQVPRPDDAVPPDEEVKDPLVLEFLGLQDEYSESDLEGALIRHLEGFLLELGNDFAFVGRQRRLRIDDDWYRVDLLFFHRRLRCLVIIDLKLGRFTHADAGQMHLYLNYAREHWVRQGENPPVGIILCAAKGEALVRYATDNLPNKLLVREYLTVLPDEKLIAAEIDKTRRRLETRLRAPSGGAAK
ncbi:MAG: DUF1016 family protein, partial [Spirochaetes bacterium]|nr:DUF1016 family protein [Spirochaetota bacterium]